jgi:hypothetical protein
MATQLDLFDATVPVKRLQDAVKGIETHLSKTDADPFSTP